MIDKITDKKTLVGSKMARVTDQVPYLDWGPPWVSGPDSIAQWVMTVFTILGVLLVLRTLVKATEANLAATAAAKAAQEANEIMREEQRPWLDFKVIDWGDIQILEQGGSISLHAFPTVEIINKGSVVARNVSFRTLVFEGGEVDTSTAIEDHVASRPIRDDAGLFVVFPGETAFRPRTSDFGRVQPAAGKKHPNSIPSWLFYSVLVYQYGGRKYYTSKLFIWSIATGDEIATAEHGHRYFTMDKAHHIWVQDHYE